MPSCRINCTEGPRPWIPEVVRNEVMVPMEKDTPVEIMKDEEAGKPEPSAPEWIRNPSIHVIVIRGRLVVGDDWRTLVRVVAIDR